MCCPLRLLGELFGESPTDELPEHFSNHNTPHSPVRFLKGSHPAQPHRKQQHFFWNLTPCELGGDFPANPLSKSGLKCSTVIPDGPPADPFFALLNVFINNSMFKTNGSGGTIVRTPSSKKGAFASWASWSRQKRPSTSSHHQEQPVHLPALDMHAENSPNCANPQTSRCPALHCLFDIVVAWPGQTFLQERHPSTLPTKKIHSPAQNLVTRSFNLPFGINPPRDCLERSNLEEA